MSIFKKFLNSVGISFTDNTSSKILETSSVDGGLPLKSNSIITLLVVESVI
jgi:hypothetical protein